MRGHHCYLLAILLSILSSVLCDVRYAVELKEGADPAFLEERGFVNLGPIGTLKNFYLVEAKSSLLAFESHPDIAWSEVQVKKRRFPKSYNFTDPLFPNQWHLINTGQEQGTAGEDIHIKDAWNWGYSGRGVRIAIVDDGYQYTHPDLTPGYSANFSNNYNHDGNSPNPNDPTPYPGYDFHGTACAGVALARNNSVCGVGAAFNAFGSGIRLISLPVDDATEAQALTFRYHDNHIYSNSWGPYDDGLTVEGPGRVTAAALRDAVINGRGGLGSIYTWAAGNGLQNHDNCNYDGYVNSIEVIAVGAVDNNGIQSYYSEPCAAMLVTAPSSGDVAGITTSDLLGTDGYSSTDCTADFGGTSSATPLVAGVVALVLEANPKLGWRDVQYVLAKTASKNDPTDIDWTTNGAGFHINHKYGFGRVNASAAVSAAISHIPFGPWSTATHRLEVHQAIPDNNRTGLSSTVRVAESLKVEHVEVVVSVTHEFAGDLQVVLTSPAGTKSVLAELHAFLLYAYIDALGVIYNAAPAAFGPSIPISQIDNIVLASPSIACTELTNCASLNGHYALIDRGTCPFVQKVLTAQNCGATAVIVANTDAGEPFEMGGESNEINIPSVMISLQAGNAIKTGLGAGPVNVTLWSIVRKFPLNFQEWRFSSVRHWDEQSQGDWTLTITDLSEGGEGVFEAWDFIVHGETNTVNDYVPSLLKMAGAAVGILASIGSAIGFYLMKLVVMH